ncbi:phosphatidylglycerol lysyltransferase domain-containing protein [Cognatishimia maritima]|uniref:Phosphatidylglycerol lysyltransferase n=1 Tax=Cognatishimia maritima TaxID=870908 RepID=A0A1M5IAY8_9RHOB|nr:phosphatidylglycerol lysyltransferase domain-containing protein [Cognatishimia maritima]SHG25421.1 phosphatidylglycerol lysyltransferase [Cognatishimia maritima]
MGQALRRTRTVLRHLIPIGIGAICCFALYDQLQHIDFAQLWTAVLAVHPLHWVMALCATMVSFWAIARYDVIAHRHFRTGTPVHRATITGATAIAIGQTTGAGAVVGTFIRWRMQSGQSLVTSAKITAFVTISFLACWAAITSAAVLIVPNSGVHLAIPCSVLAISTGVLALAFLKPVLNRAGRTFELPTLPAIAALAGFCLLDVVAACVAFWALLPAGLDLTIAQLLPVYLIALGAAILSGTPGGVGPFELTVLALLPHLPETELMAAILAFRIVYYAIPAILGGIALLRPMARKGDDWALSVDGCIDSALSQMTARAELGVVRQNGGAILHCTAGACGVVRTGQTLTALFDPVMGQTSDLVSSLKRIAKEQNRIVCKYKITKRHAVHARRAGWSVVHISDEALISTETHVTSKLAGSNFRQLRRKLRQAEKSGVKITHATDHLPLGAMAEVSKLWENSHGGARGLSMGQFEETYVARQAVFLAYDNDRLIGFITLHKTSHEWCLDLMRARPDAQDGTMHMLVQQAIETAHKNLVPCVSLAATPAGALGWHCGFEKWLRSKFFAKAGGPGLRQFKASFHPRWQPLYLAAPGRAQLLLAALDLIRSVRRAKPLRPAFALASSQVTTLPS